jgi:hypothetical protein
MRIRIAMRGDLVRQRMYSSWQVAVIAKASSGGSGRPIVLLNFILI